VVDGERLHDGECVNGEAEDDDMQKFSVELAKKVADSASSGKVNGRIYSGNEIFSTILSFD
jgi:hypothetical protein